MNPKKYFGLARNRRHVPLPQQEKFLEVRTIKCLCCKSDFPEVPDTLDLYYSATVSYFRCGWASSLDNEVYKVAICDTCLEKGTEKGLIKKLS